MAASFFDPKSYYLLSNDRNGANKSISLGYTGGAPGPVDMVQLGSYSSENWQIFYQNGIYFLRNRDFGADYQLGVTDDNRSVPRMLRPSGRLGMQWNITQWQDGTWKLTNGLLGNVPLLGVGSQSTTPAMNGDKTGAHWSVDINVSADRISNTTQLSAFPSLERAKSTASPTSSQSAVPTSLTSSPKSTPANTEQNHSHSLSTGAIAGIAVGSVAVVLGLIILLLLFRRFRRRNPHTKIHIDESTNPLYRPENKPDFMAPPPPPSKQWNTATRSELPDTETPPYTRAEMPGDSPPA